MADVLFKKDIVDNLDSNISDRPLSARMGKALKIEQTSLYEMIVKNDFKAPLLVSDEGVLIEENGDPILADWRFKIE